MPEPQLDTNVSAISIREAPLRVREPGVGVLPTRLKNPAEKVEEMSVDEYTTYCNKIVSANSDPEVTNSELIGQLEVWYPRFDERVLLHTLRTIRNVDPNRHISQGEDSSALKLRALKLDWINGHSGKLRNAYDTTIDGALKKEIVSVFRYQLLEAEGSDETKPALGFFIDNYEAMNFEPEVLQAFFAKGMTSFHKTDSVEEEPVLLAEKVFKLAKEALSRKQRNYPERYAALTGLGVGQVGLGDTPILEAEITAYLFRQIGILGIDSTSILQSWWHNFTSKDPDTKIRYGKFVADNITQMNILEEKQRGICKVLFDEFGISNFSRYPTEALISQYNDRDKNIPYGVIIYPESDYNGGFTTRRETIEQFYRNLKELGYGLRIYESGSRLEVIRAFDAANKRYGEQHKISFAIIGGHGMPEAIELGSKEKIYKRDIKKAVHLRDFFVDNPTIALDSCSTGEEAGIGQQISSLDVEVFAPTEPSYYMGIRAGLNGENRLKLLVDYRDKEGNPIAARFKSSVKLN